MLFLLWVCKNESKHLHLVDCFIESDLQMRTIEAIKINKRAMCSTCSKFFLFIIIIIII